MKVLLKSDNLGDLAPLVWNCINLIFNIYFLYKVQKQECLHCDKWQIL